MGLGNEPPRAAAEFLAEGLRRGENALVVAEPARGEALRRMIEAPIDRLVLVGAQKMLDRFMEGGMPVPERFDASVGRLVRESLYGHGATGLRVYGEMVDLLWREGCRSGAVQLEELWEQLLQRHQFSLFCAYSVDGFALAPAALEGICSRHHRLVAEDPKLDAAVDHALDETLGRDEASRVRPLIQATRRSGAEVPWAYKALCWLRRNLPEQALTVGELARARVRDFE